MTALILSAPLKKDGPKNISPSAMNAGTKAGASRIWTIFNPACFKKYKKDDP
jgi:hypothetical protein